MTMLNLNVYFLNFGQVGSVVETIFFKLSEESRSTSAESACLRSALQNWTVDSVGMMIS